jgi:pimeloyl-ACP methyl ester carboxylesterase
MPDPPSNRFLAVVPGIMGSELLDPARPSRPVWNGDVDRVLDTLSYAPEALRVGNPLTVGRIIRSVRIAGLPAKDVYGKLLGRLAKAGYRDDNLIELAYDWRQDNQRTAALLADACREKLGQGFKEWSVIAHSMGGLVVRLLLADPANQDLAQSLKKFIQIGSPVRGALSAYLALRHEFAFDQCLFDAEFRLRQVADKTLLGRLTDVLRECPSLYQLLPHAGELVLDHGAGRCDVHDASWPQFLKPFLDGAKSVQAIVAGSAPPALVAVCSQGIRTPRSFQVDRFFNRTGGPRFGPGDGTVLRTSAQAASGVDQRRTPLGRIRHDALPRARQVWTMIKAEIA